ncbi:MULTISPECIES: SDR family NAD(P)-dependent oxidoreductase [Streptomyces]|uniref:SDR family NAD(P)-dependent oxidoreductase n=1 Tax=Streptomyces TaxID=1883 RepID=UPI0016702F59|nr:MULTISPECIES: SDR family NAD(P)-dependent oxidoreductase [Streptomyces]
MSKTIVITGASDGIGLAAARQLVCEGHQVVMVGRSPHKTRAVAEELRTEHFTADFACLGDVRAVAAKIAARHRRIDVLMNNAGAILGERTVTADGFEESFQVNYLAHFLLTTLLIDPLLVGGASVIQTASNAARLSSRVELDDLNNSRRYSPVRAYGNAKMELILFTQELHRRYHSRGLSAAAFHPGGVASGFARTSRSPVGTLFRSPVPGLFFQSPAKAARQMLWLATSEPGRNWASGGYYEKRTLRAVNAPSVAAELWDRSTELLSLAP